MSSGDVIPVAAEFQRNIILPVFVIPIRFLLSGLCSVWGVDYDDVIGCMPPIISVFLALSMYFNGIFNVNKIRNVLLFIKKDCKRYQNRPENIILQNYKIQGRKIIVYYASYIYMTLIIYLLIPTIHLAIGIVMPTNHSQVKDFLFELNYGVDSQEYFYYITIHSYIGTAVVGHLIVSCYTMYVMYTQHAYALFAIVSYQLKTVHGLDSSNLINLKNDHLFKKYEYTEFTPEEQKKVHNKLFICIQEHKNAIKYSDLLESLFMKSIFFQLFFNVLCISTTGVYTVMKIGNVGDMMRYGSFTLAQIIYIFSLCLPGQRLVNHSEQVYIATCEIMWHTFSKKSLSLYKFLLARSLVFSKITALKMAPLTMETFLVIIQTAMSYFTVLLSTNDILE